MRPLIPAKYVWSDIAFFLVFFFPFFVFVFLPVLFLSAFLVSSLFRFTSSFLEASYKVQFKKKTQISSPYSVRKAQFSLWLEEEAYHPDVHFLHNSGKYYNLCSSSVICISSSSDVASNGEFRHRQECVIFQTYSLANRVTIQTAITNL